MTNTVNYTAYDEIGICEGYFELMFQSTDGYRILVSLKTSDGEYKPVECYIGNRYRGCDDEENFWKVKSAYMNMLLDSYTDAFIWRKLKAIKNQTQYNTEQVQ